MFILYTVRSICHRESYQDFYQNLTLDRHVLAIRCDRIPTCDRQTDVEWHRVMRMVWHADGHTIQIQNAASAYLVALWYSLLMTQQAINDL